MTNETRERIDNSAVAYGKKFDQDYRGYAAEDWAEGAISEHPIAFEAGRKAGFNEGLAAALEFLRKDQNANYHGWVGGQLEYYEQQLESLKK